MGLPSPEQSEALAELRAIQDALANPRSLRVWPFGAPAAEGWPELDWPAEVDDDWLVVDLQLAVPGQVHHSGSHIGPTERVRVLLPPHYPHLPPLAWGVPPGHLGGLPHVLWDGDLCLYESPTDWDPADGMPGFLTRLESWYEHAAAGTLDPIDQPAHPPLAAGAWNAGQLVVLADAPPVTGTVPLACTAVLAYRGPGHADVIGWLERPPSADELEDALDDVLQDAGSSNGPCYLAAAVLLSTPMNFTFPDTKGELVSALVARGANADLNDHIRAVAELNDLLVESGDGPWPEYLLIGSPADRTPGRSHLAAWRLDGPAEPDTVSWAVVYDQREEMVVRRDAESPLSWLHGKAVLVLGCGALGAPIAEQCLRAGAGTLLLVDSGRVNPGVLTRQPYRDADIGRPKAYALAGQLQAIRPDAHITSGHVDVLSLAEAPEQLWGVDLVVDATANSSVATFLERHRWIRTGRRPAILTVAVGHRARRGIALLAPPSASGGGWDLLGRLALAAASSRALADVADDFFPAVEQHRFRPEPGCSEPTFVGSATEVQAIGAQLFEWAVRMLSRPASPDADTMAGYVVRLSGETLANNAELRWTGDLVLTDRPDGYQVRLAPEAVALFSAEVDTAAGAGVETGGLLIGRIDSAAMVVWVTSATGPPAGSVQARDWLYLPSQDTGQLARLVRQATRQRARVLGMWHTHPHGGTDESATDRLMAAQLAALPDGPRRTLLLTLGNEPDPLPDWLAGRGRPSISVRLVSRAPKPAIPDRSAPILAEHQLDLAAPVEAVWSAFSELGVVAETSVRTRTAPHRIFWEATVADGSQLCEWLFVPTATGTRVIATESFAGASVGTDPTDLQQRLDSSIRHVLRRLRAAVDSAVEPR